MKLDSPMIFGSCVWHNDRQRINGRTTSAGGGLGVGGWGGVGVPWAMREHSPLDMCQPIADINVQYKYDD